VTVSKTAAI